MNKALISIAGIASALAIAPSAYAATTTYTPGDPNFQVTGDPFSGTVSAVIGHSGIASGAFTDIFSFTLGQTGLGSGSLATSTSIFGDITDLDINSVTINGMAATKTSTPGNLVESFYLFGVPITAGTLNTIVVDGFSRGNGSYGGNATFIPGVPEISTWAMMIVGFGVLGFSMRYRKRSVNVAYSV